MSELVSIFNTNFSSNDFQDEITLISGGIGNTSGAGVLFSNGMARVGSGSGSASFGTLISNYVINSPYNEQTIFEFSAIFSSPLTGTFQIAGVGTNENGFFFSYSNDQQGKFGIRHHHGGNREIRVLEILNGSTQNQNIVIGLENMTASVPVSIGNKFKTAHEIGAFNYYNIANGYETYVISSSVYFISRVAKNNVGSFFLSSSSPILNNFSIISKGNLPHVKFYPQSAWNIDRRDGGSTSGFVLDPQKGNTYQIMQNKSDFGSIIFSIKKPLTDEFVRVHNINGINNTKDLLLNQSNLSSRFLCVNLISGQSGSYIDIASVSGLSTFTQQKSDSLTYRSRNFSFSKNNLNTNDMTNIFSIRNSVISNNQINLLKINIISLNCSCVEGSLNNYVEIFLILNGILDNNFPWEKIGPQYPFVDINTGSNLILGGKIIYALQLLDGTREKISFESSKFILNKNDIISLVARSSGGTPTIIGSLGWII